MKYKILFFVFCLGIFNTNVAQSDESGSFFGGVNVGGFFANKNTAIMYTGSIDITNYGPQYIFSLPTYKPALDEYFKYTYSIVELPQTFSYRPAMDVGAHIGVSLGEGNAFYIDANFSNLAFENFFTVEIEDPNNQSPDPTYEQIPMFGNEKRFNLNLGLQFSLYKEGAVNVYLPVFANLNSTKLINNYFYINGRQYYITHTIPGQPNVTPGGIGYGAGSGLGAKYKFNDKFTFDLAYSLYYSKINMKDDFAPWGVHHGIVLRIIWG